MALVFLVGSPGSPDEWGWELPADGIPLCGEAYLYGDTAAACGDTAGSSKDIDSLPWSVFALIVVSFLCVVLTAYVARMTLSASSSKSVKCDQPCCESECNIEFVGNPILPAKDDV